MRAEVKTITPEQAKSWLESNINNRPVRKQKVRSYVRSIVNGNFHATNLGIGFFEDGSLADGQHRLMAIAEAGIPVEALVVYGLKREVSPHIDTGSNRTGADVLIMFRGVDSKDAKALSGACKMLLNFHKGGQWANTGSGRTGDGGMGSVDNEVLLEFFDRHEEQLLESVEFVREKGVLTKGLIPKSAQIALHYVFSTKDRELGENYLIKILHGYGIEPDTVEAHVRQFLFDASISGKTHRITDKCRTYTVVKGFNFLRRNFTPKQPGRVVWKSEQDGETYFPS
jgi:hypothetical protein